MSWFFVVGLPALILVIALAALTLKGFVKGFGGLPRWLCTALATPLLVGPVAALSAYVASEDDYRANGTPRWDAYGADARTIFWIALALVVAALALVAAGDLARRTSPRLGGAAIGTLAACAQITAYIAFTAN